MPSRSAHSSDAGLVDSAALLARVPLFNHLAPPQLAQIVAATRRRQIGKGQILFHKGDTPQGLFALVFGKIKLTISSPHGTEKVVDIVGEGQTVGDAVMFLDRPYPLTATALTDCLALCVGRSAIIELLRENTCFSEHFIVGLCTRVFTLVDEMGATSLQSAAQRVVSYLLRCSQDYNMDEGSTKITLNVPKQVIASQLNVTPETLSRIFHELAEAKLIAVKGKQIEIFEVERLRELGN